MRDIGGVEMPAYFGKLMDPMQDELTPAAPPTDGQDDGATAEVAASSDDGGTTG